MEDIRDMGQGNITDKELERDFVNLFNQNEDSIGLISKEEFMEQYGKENHDSLEKLLKEKYAKENEK